MPLVSLENVHYDYTGTESIVHALRGVSLEFDAGEFVAVTGASGSGKSTLLNIIGTLERPTAGRYLFDGKDVATMSNTALAKLRAAQIGFVFQNFNLIDHLTVYENIKLGVTYHRDRKIDVRQAVTEAMDRVGMRHRAHHLPRQLSGGQQQRCAIARAIVGNPAIVLADEPTGNLDSKHGAQVLGILHDLNARGTTVVIVTHAQTQADLASRVIEMHDGRIHVTSRRVS